MILLSCLAFLTTLGGSVGAATPISDCTTISSPGIYVLTADTIYSSAIKCIEITSSDVIFDGAGHMIGGLDTSNTYGVYVYSEVGLTNITIKNLRVSDWWGSGIRYEDIENGSIENNTLSSNYLGIRIDSSEDNKISGNRLYDNGDAIYLISSTRNTVTGNKVSSNTPGNGIRLYSSNYNTLTDNTVLGIPFSGVRLYSSNYNKIMNNIVNSQGTDAIGEEGISLRSSSNYNTLENNTISNNWNGISLEYSSENLVDANNIRSSENGIFIGPSKNNTLTGNTVSNSDLYGIYVHPSTSNIIYDNRFNNTVNFYFSGASANRWNNKRQAGPNIVLGPFIGGNFWAKPDGTGFSEICADVNWDGICDIGYTLAPENVDYLPLSSSLIISASLDVHPDVINLKKGGPDHGRWLTTYIELPEGYDITHINASTVLLYGIIPADPDLSYVGDYNKDNIQDLTVNFNYHSVQTLLAGNFGEIGIIVSGELADGTPFGGTYPIQVTGNYNPAHYKGRAIYKTNLTATYLPMRIWQWMHGSGR